MRFATALSVTLTAALLAACTAGADQLTEPAAADGEGTSAGVGLTATVSELDLDLPDGFEVDTDTFVLRSLDPVGDRLVGAGRHTRPGSPAAPAVYHTAVTDPTSWQLGALLLPDGYVGNGGAQAVDAPDVVVAAHQADTHETHASLWTKDPDPQLLAVIDDADHLQVNNVSRDDGGELIAVGVVRELDRRSPAAWRVSDDGEVARLPLPDTPDHGQLTAAVAADGTATIYGADDDAGEVFVLAGDTFDDLELVPLDSGLTNARTIATAVATPSGTVWVAGATIGSGSGEQAVWVRRDGGYRDVTRRVRDGEDPFTSTAGRLVVEPLDDGHEMVKVVEGGRTWWWTADGSTIRETLHLGGQIAANEYGDWWFSYEPIEHLYRLDDEPFDVDLPDGPSRAGAATVVGADDGLLAVRTGHVDERETRLVAAGEEVGVVPGDVALHRAAGHRAAVGTATDDYIVRPVIADVADDNTIDAADLPVPDEDSPAVRASALVDLDGTPTVLGHMWLDNELHAAAWQRDDTGWAAADVPAGLADGRAVSGPCGPHAVTTNGSDGDGGVALLDGGALSDVLLPERMSRQSMFGCDTTPDGAAWYAGHEDLVRIDADGDVTTATPDDATWLYGLTVVPDRELVVALGARPGAFGTLTVWATPADDPDGWQELATHDTPAGTTDWRFAGTDGGQLVVTARYGTQPRAWKVEVR